MFVDVVKKRLESVEWRIHGLWMCETCLILGNKCLPQSILSLHPLCKRGLETERFLKGKL